ncbi:hypothetical protein VZT92_006526 [Zoarces viviparus]|uniref:Uncharacterized protein n=1 Tax=Zoarces viviparus TaxID=48416 RepID=A0AAW1FQ32_ZOAVI
MCKKKKKKEVRQLSNADNWLQAVQQLLRCALRWKDCVIASFQFEPIEGGAGRLSHRRSCSSLRGTLHRTDRVATIP